MDPAIGCLILFGVMAPLFIGGNRNGRRHNLRFFKLYTR